MATRFRSIRLVAVFVTGTLLLGACGDDGGNEKERGINTDDASSALRVAHFDFPESSLLAELYAQALTANGVPTRRISTTGPREILGPALLQGQVDLLPEYLGTATAYFGAGDSPADPITLDDLQQRLEPSGLTALAAAPATNTNVFVVRATDGLGPRISDLADVASTLRFGGLPECRDRPLCLAGLEDRYELRFAEFVPFSSLAVTAEALRRDEIDVGLMFSTDAAITDDFLVLRDDLALQPPENVVPVLRTESLARWGETTVRAALDAVSRLLPTFELRTLNRRVADGDDIAVVAAEWLVDHGLAVAG
jgi:osmoprotectant transport system substrate-binding protein